MEPFKHRIFFCTNQKDPSKSSCAQRGCHETLKALESEIKKAGLKYDVKITTTSCLGPCETGPNLIVAPEDTWYFGLTPDLVPEFVQTQIVEGKRYEKRAWNENKLKDFFEKKIARKKKEEGMGG